MTTPAFKRILLKLSGEALAAGQGFGVDNTRVHEIAGEIAEVHQLGVDVAIVVGGGNFFRGVAEQAQHMDRVSADHMGMLATVINALALQDALEKNGSQTRVMSAIEMHEVAEPFIRRRAIRHLEKGRVVVFAAGTGNPYFSTDTAASLRAMEIHADAILKATKVDGIYTADPVKDKTATKFEKITYLDILKLGLKVMDATAIAMCQPRGTVVMKSTVHGLVQIDAAPAIVNEITLVGSRCGRFEPAIKLLASRKIRVDNLIADRFALSDAPKAFKKAAQSGVIKVLFEP